MTQNQTRSPLLRLPAELRNQIYSHLDLGGHTIQIISKSSNEVRIISNLTCPIHDPNKGQRRLWYRVEQVTDQEYLSSNGKYSPITGPRKQCASLQALFALPHVCRQLRAETTLLIYELNSFAFSDKAYNYSRAIKQWTQSLDAREKAAVNSICWPLRQARNFYQFSQHAQAMQLPDRACTEELRSLVNLKKVVLRSIATDVGMAKLSPSEYAELEALYVARGVRGYSTEREFRRSLAVRGMREQLGLAEVDIRCEKTWRART
jgi:hypothetical protein